MSEGKSIILKGIVVSDVMDKTIVVLVRSFRTHSKYLKKFISSKKYKVHDPSNRYSVGDEVLFRGCRPVSKDKSFIVIES